MSIIGGASQGGLVDTGDIGHSLRLRSSNSAYLSRTPASAGNRQKYTLSMWVKRGALGAAQTLFSAGTGPTNIIGFGADDKLRFYETNAAVTASEEQNTTAVFRDPLAHLHIVVAVDTTQATYANRVKIYVTNVLQSVTVTNQNIQITQNALLSINRSGAAHNIGRFALNSTQYFDGYMSRIAFVDGQALTPDSFGYFNTESNEWVTKSQAAVKAVVDAGGTNSFMLDFDDGTSLTTLGYDKSSKGNNWTLNNFSLTAGPTYDWMLDTPSNNFPVWNPLNSLTAMAVENGNLRASVASGNAFKPATIPIVGKAYAEFYINSGTGNLPGIVPPNMGASFPGSSAGGYGWWQGDRRLYFAGSAGAELGSYTVFDIIQIAMDQATGKLWFGKNGTWVASGNPANGTNPVATAAIGEWFFSAGGSGAGASDQIANFGQRPFAYTPPTGFKAICTANLPDDETITTSGSFPGNASADGPYIDIKGVPTAMTINGNAVTFGTHADKTAFGFKVRSSSASYNSAGTNTYSITSTGAKRKYSNAQGNP